jgi:hypothetical protein
MLLIYWLMRMFSANGQSLGASWHGQRSLNPIWRFAAEIVGDAGRHLPWSTMQFGP